MIPATAKSATLSCVPNCLCYYSNSTHQMEVIRVINIPDFKFEKVVFPGQRILFEAVAEGQLAVYTSRGKNKIFAQLISCKDLKIEDQCERSQIEAYSA